MKVGRNDPCPCGSGKKYKKCCANKVIDVSEQKNRILKRELNEFHMKLGEFFIDLNDEFAEIVASFYDREDLRGEPNAMDNYKLLLALWALFNSPLGFYQRFFQDIENELRPSVKAIVENWNKVPGFYEVLRKIDNTHYEVKKIGTNERIIVEKDPEEVQPGVGNGIIGVLVPFGEENHEFLLGFHEFELEDLMEVYRYYQNGSTKDFQELLRTDFPDVLSTLFGGEDEIDEVIESLDWQNAQYKRVAECFSENCVDLGPTEQVVAIELWHGFCERTKPRIGKIEGYAAGLEYLIHQLEGNDFTQKQMAAKYQVSPTTVSLRFQDLEALHAEILRDSVGTELTGPDNGVYMDYERKMKDLKRLLQEQEFQSEEEINQFIGNYLESETERPASHSKKEKAEDLLYEAWECEAPRKYELARKALRLNPNLPDAYLLLSEKAETLRERLDYLQAGVQAGERDLGRAYFKENAGYFWGLVETRPYMRLKLFYAETLLALGEEEKAIEEYREMLELNPGDNQGVRYVLLTALLSSGKLKEAEDLFQSYGQERTANFAYNHVYLDYALNGWTRHTDLLLRQAYGVNPHVPKYLTGKKKIPKVLPDYIRTGDDTEAIDYAADHLELWRETNLKSKLEKYT